jgi:hypothetical protein
MRYDPEGKGPEAVKLEARDAVRLPMDANEDRRCFAGAANRKTELAL